MLRRQLRHRMEVEYQEQPRTRERKREDAEVKRQTQRALTPLLTPPKQNKYKTSSYNRPRAASQPASEKTSPTSVTHSRQHGNKKSSVERLPDLVSRAQRYPTDQKASKTRRRAQNNSSVRCSMISFTEDRTFLYTQRNLCRFLGHSGPPYLIQLCHNSPESKDQPSQCLQSVPAIPKTKQCKMSPKHTPSTRRRIQDRRKDLSESKLNTTATVFPQKTSQHTTTDIQRTDSDFLPRPLTTPNQNHVYWTHLHSWGSFSPSLESSDYSSVSLGNSIVRPISRDLQSMEGLASESENEDEDEGCFTSWHDLRPGSSQPSVLQTFSPGRTSSLFSTPRALPPQDSPYGTRLPHRQPPVAPSGTSSPLINRGGTLGDHYHLPALVIRPRRSPPASLDGAGRMETNSLDTASSGQKDRENMEGALGGPAGGQSTGAAAQPSTASLTHNLTLALQYLRIEVTQRDGLHDTGHSGKPQRDRSCNPETLRRITESLVEEGSDEEDEMCRICLCNSTSPTNPLLSPCQCSGSLQYIHHDCLKRWIQTKIELGAELSVVKTCELCKGSLDLDLEGFGLEEYYCRHRSPQVGLETPQLFLLLLLLLQIFRAFAADR